MREGARQARRHAVQVADSGAAALAAMQEVPPALAVGAMHLSDMSGVELLVAMRADETLAGVAFVLVSSETREEILDPIRQSGASAILPKPFSDADLVAALAATSTGSIRTSVSMPTSISSGCASCSSMTARTPGNSCGASSATSASKTSPRWGRARGGGSSRPRCSIW